MAISHPYRWWYNLLQRPRSSPGQTLALQLNYSIKPLSELLPWFSSHLLLSWYLRVSWILFTSPTAEKGLGLKRIETTNSNSEHMNWKSRGSNIAQVFSESSRKKLIFTFEWKSQVVVAGITTIVRQEHWMKLCTCCRCRNKIRMNGWVDTTEGSYMGDYQGVTIIKMRIGKSPLYLFFSSSFTEMIKKHPKIATLTIACSCTSRHTKTEDWPVRR